MKGFDGHPGTSKLASVLSKRIKKENESPLILDFGEIQENYSLVTNTFPIPIPRGDYSVCSHVRSQIFRVSDNDNTEDKKIYRVLVAWVQSEAIVIDIIEKS